MMIGSVHPTGDHGEDMRRVQHLEDLIEITGSLVDTIEEVAEHKNEARSSYQTLGKMAAEFRNKLTAYEE